MAALACIRSHRLRMPPLFWCGTLEKGATALNVIRGLGERLRSLAQGIRNRGLAASESGALGYQRRHAVRLSS